MCSDSNIPTEQPTKTCSRCKRTLPLDAFHADRERSDGRRSQCRECANAQAGIYGAANRETIRVRNRIRREANPEKARTVVRTWRAANREANRNAAHVYRRANSEKHCAQVAVERAIREGKLSPARECFCFVCGTSADMGAIMHYHHVDYAKALEVVPVCSVCHGLIHRK